jgi:hypothetical protein
MEKRVLVIGSIWRIYGLPLMRWPLQINIVLYVYKSSDMTRFWLYERNWNKFCALLIIRRPFMNKVYTNHQQRPRMKKEIPTMYAVFTIYFENRSFRVTYSFLNVQEYQCHTKNVFTSMHCTLTAIIYDYHSQCNSYTQNLLNSF